MKLMKALPVLLAFAATAHAETYPTRLLGTFAVSDDSLFSPRAGTITVRLVHGRPVMTSSMDVTGRQCGSVIGAFEGVSQAYGAADATFALSSAHCYIDGRSITLHYNRALTGVDVYEAQVVLRQGTLTSHGVQGREVQTWSLEKR